MIISDDNKRIKDIIKLNQKKYRDLYNKFIIEGDHLVEEAYKNNYLEEIIALENKDINIDFNNITYVSLNIMKKITNLDNPSSIIGVCKKINKDYIGNKILLLDDIQDPGNLGTIIRSSKAFNIDTILLSNNTVDLYNSKVLRSTQGIIFNINIIRCDIIDMLNKLKSDKYKIYITDVEDGYDIKDISMDDKFCLVIGNEGRGVRKELKEIKDFSICITTNKEVESLNVGVATSIILYEIDKKVK